MLTTSNALTPINNKTLCLRNEQQNPKSIRELPTNYLSEHPRTLLLDMLQCPTFLDVECTRKNRRNRIQLVAWRSTLNIRSTVEEFTAYGSSKQESMLYAAEKAVSKIYGVTYPSIIEKDISDSDNCKKEQRHLHSDSLSTTDFSVEPHKDGNESPNRDEPEEHQSSDTQQHPQTSSGQINIPQSNIAEIPTEMQISTFSDTESLYPKAPLSGDCRLLINEVATRNDYNSISFIEHIKVCPVNSKGSRSILISGFVEIVLLSGLVIQQTLYANFDRQKLVAVTEKKEGSTRNFKHMYFLFGTEASQPNMKLQDGQATLAFREGLPNSDGSTICIVLLHFETSSKDYEKLKLTHDGTNFIPSVLTDEKMEVINNNIQDVVIIGPPCPESECGYFFSLLRMKDDVVGDVGMLIPITEIPTNADGKHPYMSHSLCSKSSLPMQVGSYQYTEPTPNRMNLCIFTTLPFKFQGTALQSTAQKLIVNINSFFEMQDLHGSALIGKAAEKTSTVTGLGKTKIYQVLANYKSNDIKTPGKKRARLSPVADQFDVMRCEQVRNTIISFYQQNRAPIFDQIYDKFMSDTREEERGRQERGEIFTPLKCSKWSFRELLRKLDFKYGTINKRAVVLMREDVVARRSYYLKSMKYNRDSPNPKCVIFTDETWIDPYARTGKSWIPKHPKSFQEEALFSFKNPKSGRGPRVIVLHAGGSDGFVEGAMKVYSVSKKRFYFKHVKYNVPVFYSKAVFQVTEDYHSNVDGKSYMEWWKTLNGIVKQKYGACIIVIDNAPYHSTSEAPKSGDKKQVFYDWLAANLEGAARANFKAITQYKRPELWKMVMDMKKTNKYYLVDREAQNYGNTVVRLPPYNCDLNPIEYVWKDIKQAVKAENTEATSAFAVKKAEEIMNSYTKEQWKRHLDHVFRLEEKYWKNDMVYDSFLDNFEDRIQPELPAWVQEGVRITQQDIEDEEDDWEIPLDGYDPFRHSVHDDMTLPDSLSMFHENDETSAEVELDPTSRRRQDFETDD